MGDPSKYEKVPAGTLADLRERADTAEAALAGARAVIATQQETAKDLERYADGYEQDRDRLKAALAGVYELLTTAQRDDPFINPPPDFDPAAMPATRSPYVTVGEAELAHLRARCTYWRARAATDTPQPMTADEAIDFAAARMASWCHPAHAARLRAEWAKRGPSDVSASCLPDTPKTEKVSDNG